MAPRPRGEPLGASLWVVGSAPRTDFVPPRSKKKASPKTVASKKSVPKAERRRQILEAAREVFAKRGYAQTTVDDIVARAGVARGTFYLYFDDKRAAFAELIDRFATQLSEAIVRIQVGVGERSVADQVRENIRAVLGVCLAESTMTKILFTDAPGVDHEFQSRVTSFYDTVMQILIESLRDGQALGIVADGEPRVLAYLSLGALKELLYQVVTLGLTEESADALTQQMFDFLCAGYLRVEGPKRPPQKTSHKLR